MAYRRRTGKRLGTRKIRHRDKQSGWSKGHKAKMNGQHGHGQVGDMNSRLPTKDIRAKKCTRSVDRNHRRDNIVSVGEILEEAIKNGDKSGTA